MVEVDDDEPLPDEPCGAPAGLASRRRREGRVDQSRARASSKTRCTQVHWNRRRAAEQLGVSYKTLLNKIKECGISRK